MTFPIKRHSDFGVLFYDDWPSPPFHYQLLVRVSSNIWYLKEKNRLYIKLIYFSWGSTRLRILFRVKTIKKRLKCRLYIGIGPITALFWVHRPHFSGWSPVRTARTRTKWSILGITSISRFKDNQLDPIRFHLRPFQILPQCILTVWSDDLLISEVLQSVWLLTFQRFCMKLTVFKVDLFKSPWVSEL